MTNRSRCFIAISALLFASHAYAQTGAARMLAAPAEVALAPVGSLVRVEVLGGTSAPLDLQGSARVVLFDRLFVYAGLGGGMYGELYGAIGRAAGGDAAGRLASQLGNGLFAFHLGVGVRPFEGSGFEIAGGYALLYRSTRVALGDAAAIIGVQGMSGDIDAELVLHTLQVELAWTFAIDDRVLIRPALGWTHTLGASASLRAVGSSSAEEDAALAQVGPALAAGARQYGMTPTVSLAVGYRF